MLAVPASRLLLKHLPMLVAQDRQARPAQLLDFHQHGSLQDLLLSVAVNHSPMNALCRSTGKQNPSGMRKETSQNCLALADGRSAKPKVNSLNGAVAAGRRVSGNFSQNWLSLA